MGVAVVEFFPNIALVGGFFARTTADDPIDPFANDSDNYLAGGCQGRLNLIIESQQARQSQAKLALERNSICWFRRCRTDRRDDVVRRSREMDARKRAMKAGKGWLISNTMNFGLGLTSR